LEADLSNSAFTIRATDEAGEVVYDFKQDASQANTPSNGRRSAAE
jgi:hypothetical protein